MNCTDCTERISRLMEKGVCVPAPGSVELGADVDLDRISGDGVILHAGARIRGAKTYICAGAVLGREAPVSIENCQLGPGVELKGGYFKDAVFLAKSAMGSGAHVREGTILEEEASGAHTVGLKQTILFPYVTLGSLINFCDCFMAGGTSRRDHSEVGSSYIHFNFTPNQDKATASLLGDVPRGVMLNQPPIFLGGQGGLVGPCRLAFGTVVAAGSICRKDEVRPGRLLVAGGARGGNIPFVAGMYRSIRRIVQNNVLYLGNLVALRAWYAVVRRQFVSREFPEELLAGLLEKVDMGIDERIRRLGAFSEKMSESARIYRELAAGNVSEDLLAQKAQLHDRWPVLSQRFEALRGYTGEDGEVERMINVIQAGIARGGRDYPGVIKQLDSGMTEAGSRWLQTIVDHCAGAAHDLLPAFGWTAP